MKVKTALMMMTAVMASPRVSMPSPGWRYWDRNDSRAASQSTTARKCVNCFRNRAMSGAFRASEISFGPNSDSRRLASFSARPDSLVTRLWRTSFSARVLIFMAGVLYDKVAGCFPQHILHRITAEEGAQEAPLAGAHDNEVVPPGSGFDRDAPSDGARRELAFVDDAVFLEAVQKISHIRWYSLFPLNGREMDIAMEKFCDRFCHMKDMDLCIERRCHH